MGPINPTRLTRLMPMKPTRLKADKAIVINKAIGAKETNKREANAIKEIVVTDKVIEFHEVVLVNKADDLTVHQN